MQSISKIGIITIVNIKAQISFEHQTLLPVQTE